MFTSSLGLAQFEKSKLVEVAGPAMVSMTGQ